MGLSERLSVPQSPDARRPRASHPKGFEPGVSYDSGRMVEAAVNIAPGELIPEDEQAWRDHIQRTTGMTVPEGRRVELTQVRTWGDQASPYTYMRFVITDRETVDPGVDAVSILKELRPRKAVKTAFTGETTLCISLNDWQVGKAAGGGTQALAERLDAAYTAVAARARELRKIGRDLGELVVLGGGDIVEGCSIFGNQPFEIDSDRRAQVRNAVTLILEGLDRLAPLFSRVRVMAVGGNHGENRLGGKRTTRHDNDDCAVFEHAALAAARDPRLGHVEWSIAQDEPVKTMDVHGWILGTTHGQVFGRGSGSIEARAYKWYSGQAAGHLPAGDCHLLVTHHYHHLAMRDWGACQWVQTPAMDGGSAFFTDFSGQHSEPGMLTWTMSPEKRFADPQIL